LLHLAARFLCTGNHDFTEPSMPYRNRRILVEDGAWIGAQTFVGPGVVIGGEAVIAAGSVVTGISREKCAVRGIPVSPSARAGASPQIKDYK